MRWMKIGATDLLECEACDGTWLEASAFERLCADREGQTALVHREIPQPAAATRSPVDKVRYRPCPRCGKLMNRMNFGRVSGTVVDVCRGHGTFLDRGELHQVVQFILDGGMDRARQHEHDERIEEQRRLLELERGSPVTGISVYASTGWDDSALQKFLSALLNRS